MFTTITPVQHEALQHYNATNNKTKFRKSGTTAINLINENDIGLNYKIMLASILQILGSEIYIVMDSDTTKESQNKDVLLYFESSYDVFWKIVNEFLSLAKLQVDKTPLGASDKILARDSYINFIHAPSSETEHKIIILITLINMFSETKIEPNRPFSKKSMYIHKKLDILLSSILLFDKNKC